MHANPMAVSILILAVVMAAGSSYADAPRHDPAPDRGEHVARLVCAACHNVAADQEFPPLMDPPAPSFKEIANRPAMTVQSVKHFVLTTHWDPPYGMPLRMPSPLLLPTDANDVAKYVMSLRKP